MKRGFAAQFGERFTRRLLSWLKFLSPQQATGYFGIFTTAQRAVVPHFRFKKDLILNLNSSRAARSGEFKFKPLLSEIVKEGFMRTGFLKFPVFRPKERYFTSLGQLMHSCQPVYLDLL
jgi:hypothetical protein